MLVQSIFGGVNEKFPLALGRARNNTRQTGPKGQLGGRFISSYILCVVLSVVVLGGLGACRSKNEADSFSRGGAPGVPDAPVKKAEPKVRRTPIESEDLGARDELLPKDQSPSSGAKHEAPAPVKTAAASQAPKKSSPTAEKPPLPKNSEPPPHPNELAQSQELDFPTSQPPPPLPIPIIPQFEVFLPPDTFVAESWNPFVNVHELRESNPGLAGTVSQMLTITELRWAQSRPLLQIPLGQATSDTDEIRNTGDVAVEVADMSVFVFNAIRLKENCRWRQNETPRFCVVVERKAFNAGRVSAGLVGVVDNDRYSSIVSIKKEVLRGGGVSRMYNLYLSIIRGETAKIWQSQGRENNEYAVVIYSLDGP